MFRETSAVGATDHAHELGDLAPLLGLIARGDGALDAMGNVIAQNFLLGAPQGCAHRRNLRDDVDAVTIVLDHPGKAADLAFDTFEPLEGGRLDIAAHAPYIPLRGSGFKSRRKGHR